MTETRLDIALPGGPMAAATARRALQQLPYDLGPQVLSTLRLLATELVANSVRHAHSRDVRLRVSVENRVVRLEVTDYGPGFDREAAQREAALNEEAGWGLLLVDALAPRWGVERHGRGTRVWFELRR